MYSYVARKLIKLRVYLKHRHLFISCVTYYLLQLYNDQNLQTEITTNIQKPRIYKVTLHIHASAHLTVYRSNVLRFTIVFRSPTGIRRCFMDPFPRSSTMIAFIPGILVFYIIHQISTSVRFGFELLFKPIVFDITLFFVLIIVKLVHLTRSNVSSYRF